MSKVIKPDRVFHSEGFVQIPDGNAPPANEQDDGLSREGSLDPQEAQKSFFDSEEERIRRMVLNAHREKEEILSRAHAEAMEIRQQARQKGYAEAHSELKEQALECIAKADLLLEKMHADQRAYFQEYEKELCGLALTIAEKVLGRSVAENQLALQELVRQAVLRIKHVDWISIEVSERLPQLISWLENDFSPQFGNREIEVSGRDMPPDSIVLQTVDGVIDVSVSTQLDNIRELFAQMD